MKGLDKFMKTGKEELPANGWDWDYETLTPVVPGEKESEK